MREIKFRGKSYSWHYGDLIHDSCNGRELIFIDNNAERTRHSVDKDTVGQFTGLRDCEGREIYEGDVLNNLYGHLGVSYKQEWAAFVACGVDKTGYYHEYLLDEIVNTPVRRSEIKVIGNVHDSPELLEADNARD